MATTFGNIFVQGFLITASLESAYLVPASVKTSIINNARVTNYGTTPETFSVQVIPNGGSAADANIAIDEKSIAPGETILLSEIIGEPLVTGDDVQAIASTVTKLSMTLGGTNKTTT